MTNHWWPRLYSLLIFFMQEAQFHVKREVERAHSRYLKHSGPTTYTGLAEARNITSDWTRRHALKGNMVLVTVFSSMLPLNCAYSQFFAGGGPSPLRVGARNPVSAPVAIIGIHGYATILSHCDMLFPYSHSTLLYKWAEPKSPPQ